jgi:ribosomal protein S18 acetylase RimI-like enzyme
MALPAELEIRTPTPADHDAVVRVLSDAFADDPVFSWLYPDAPTRARVLPSFFALFATHSERLGGNQVAGDGRGAAVWVPPGEVLVAPEHEEAFGTELVGLHPEAAERMLMLNVAFDAHHPQEPHWYLSLLGVASTDRGQGVGSALLREALARIDEAGMPAYLEATSVDNRRLYERHGFEVVADLALPDGPTAFAMRRERRTCPTRRGRFRTSA